MTTDNPIPPVDFDPDAEVQPVLTRQQSRAKLVEQYINQHLPEGYFASYTWRDDPLEYLRVEFENTISGRKVYTDATYETLLKQSIRYLGEHIIKTLVDSDTNNYVRE